jgi:hypothetical protein
MQVKDLIIGSTYVDTSDGEWVTLKGLDLENGYVVYDWFGLHACSVPHFLSYFIEKDKWTTADALKADIATTKEELERKAAELQALEQELLELEGPEQND